MSEMVSMVVDDATDQMKAAVTHTRHDMASIRTGRATPALVEKMPVEYYGADVPMQQIAGFSVPEARTLMISPFDKTAIDAIERAIQSSDLGLNPSSDGAVLRLTFPQLTEERRRELVKIVKSMAEEGRVSIRNTRRAARQDLEAFEKDGDMSEDDLHRAEAALDKITRTHEAKIDDALQQKEAELLEV